MPRRRLKRWLLVAGGVLAVVVLAIAAVVVVAYTSADATNVGRLRFANELRIPPLLEPRTDQEGTKVFQLGLQRGTTELLPGKPAETWGANGSYLGPTLRAARGDYVRVQVTNELPEATTIHWHGMHLPARADGGPHQPIERGLMWMPEWRIDQPAATLWYHPHPHPHTADHVYRGVAGMFIVDDPDAARLALPRDYGVDDIPVIVQDKQLEDDGSLDLGVDPFGPVGRLGDEILVNGTYDPYVEVEHQRVRLRVLNASDARIYNVGFSDDRAFQLIGTDGGLLAAPHRTRRVHLSPGERAEIVAAFEPGERVTLRSFEPDLGTDFFTARFSGGDDTFDLLQIRAADELAAAPPVPERLADVPAPDEAEATRTRRFGLSSSDAINGLSMEMTRIDQRVGAGTTEIWEVRNQTGTPHNFHVHGVSFRVLDEPGPAGWKDTVFAPPGETLRLLIRFGGSRDARTPYMFHCHVLAHEDRGMMGQFVVD
jgi:FtsP/CotA-like multicopper oxidase with cupredoxin domain